MSSLNHAFFTDKTPGVCPFPDVTIHTATLDDDQDIPLKRAEMLLSPSEWARASHFRFTRHRNRYVRARGFLREQLGFSTGSAAATLPIYEGRYGKPFLPGGPVFNLSHSCDVAVLAIGGQIDIGIDIELFDRVLDTTGLERTCLNQTEQQALYANSSDIHQNQFLAFWTAKEARMKMTGEGMVLPPLGISLKLDADGWPIGYLTPSQPPADLYFVTLEIKGAVCCLCRASEASGYVSSQKRVHT